MWMSIGNAGWTRFIDMPGLPDDTRLYVRFRQVDSRLRLTEIYLEGAGVSLSTEAIRSLPMARIEAEANTEDSFRKVVDRIRLPGPDLSTLASYFDTTFGSQADERDWVVLSMRSQFPGSGLPQPGHAPRAGFAEGAQVRTVRLGPPSSDGLTDDFFRQVAASYERAVQEGKAPAPTLAEEAGVPVRTVHRWVYLARKAGIMPRGTQGSTAGKHTKREASDE